MDTEVYLLCKNCNGITDGIGSGDIEDFISCSGCGGKMVRASFIGMLKPLGLKEKRFYIEKDKFDISVKE
ncbi:hypothetical protein [Spirochaeta dissipatitropha]